MKRLLTSIILILAFLVHSPLQAQSAQQVAGTATKTASMSGNWSSTSTWGGSLPANDDRVLIPNGITLTVDGMIAEEMKSVRIADGGKLEFNTSLNTELRTEYLFSSMMGELEIGTSTNKLANGVKASLVFAERGGTSSSFDPHRFAPGAVLMGTTTMHGANKTSWLELQIHPSSGDNQFTLKSNPIGWEIGDKLVVAGTDPISTIAANNTSDFEKDEVVTITAIAGNIITFSPALVRDHKAPSQANDLEVHVANLSRNIVISSENPSISSLSGDFQKPRGHLMFMHTLNVDLRYVEANNLGRTDKTILLDDWDFSDLDANQNTGSPVTNGGRNPRGRYSFHFHRGGMNTSVFPAKPITPLPNPAHVEGCVVNTDPGWGFVNHSSRVNFIRNVSYNVVGGAFSTEAGNETGSFIENIAIRTVNPLNPIMAAPRPRGSYIYGAPTNSLVDLKENRQDFAWQGDGFWFHGTGVTVRGNVVSGCTGHAFVYWTEGLVEKGLGMARGSIDAHVPASEFPSQNAALTAWKNTYPNFVLDVWYLQPRAFSKNTAYGFARGVQTYYTHTEFHRKVDPTETDPNGWMNDLPDSYKDQLNLILDSTILWNIGRVGFESNHSTNITIQNARVVAYGARTGYENYGANPAPNYVNYEPEVIGMDLDFYHNTHRWTFKNNTLEGFSGSSVAISLPKNGQVTVDGGNFNNSGEDIRINAPSQHLVNDDGEGFGIGMSSTPPSQSTILIKGPITFKNPNNNIVMDAEIIYDQVSQKGFHLIDGAKEDELYFLAPQEITLNFGPFNSGRLYFNAQAGNYIPIVPNGNRCAFSEPSVCVGGEYAGKSNTQLQAQFGSSFCDQIMPLSATTHPIIVGGKIKASAIGLDEIPLNQRIDVYPNPSRDGIFNLERDEELEIDQVVVYSATGSRVFSATLETSRLALSHLPAGLYSLKFLSSQKAIRITKTVLIK